MATVAKKVVLNGTVLKVIGGWVYGVIDGFRFEAGVYQGRVSKLFIERNLPGYRAVFDFDRAGGLVTDNAPVGLVEKIVGLLEVV